MSQPDEFENASPYRSSSVLPSSSARKVPFRTVLILGGVFLATLTLGRIVSLASPELQQTLRATETKNCCQSGQCAMGLTPIGLPESTLVLDQTHPASEAGDN